MTTLWRDTLKFETRILSESYDDCSEDSIRAFRDICRDEVKNNPKYDGLICIVSGHGTLGHIVASDGEKININENLIIFFKGKNAKYLANYPKIFIFDTCRGQAPADVHTGKSCNS